MDHITPNPAPTSAPFRSVGAAGVSVLLGIGVAMALMGVIARLTVSHQTWAPSRRVVGGGALVALALGVLWPQRFASWAYGIAWRRRHGTAMETDLPSVAAGRHRPDAMLHWIALSVVATLAGGAVAAIPYGADLGQYAYGWMLDRFFWHPIALTALIVALAFAVVLPPFAMLGLACSCTHHLLCRYRRWDTRASAWLIVGIGVGVGVAQTTLRATARSDLLTYAAALPVLLSALFSAALCSLRGGSIESEPEDIASGAPAWRAYWPTLLRASVVALTIAGGLAAWLWVHETQGDVPSPLWAVPALCVMGGIGMLLGSRPKRNGMRSVGGFGMACAAAGTVVAFGPAAVLLVFDHGPIGLVLPGFVGLAAIGFAVGYGQQALLHRVGSRSRVGAITLTRMLVAVAATLCLFAPALHSLLGAHVALSAVALVLLALGGTLVIHDPMHSARTRAVRLCVVFGVLTAMIALAVLGPTAKTPTPISGHDASASALP